MPVSNINDSTAPHIVLASRNTSQSSGFSRILNNTVPDQTGRPTHSEPAGPEKKPGGNDTSYITLGRISSTTPTVSHILKNHARFSDECWDIIFSESNRGKDFTKMRDGTLVALKPGSNEIIWGKKLDRLISTSGGTGPDSAQNRTVTGPGNSRSMVIGTISRENPTVSHLFEANPNFDSRFWDIIHSPVNTHKEYTLLPPGTEVTLDTKTLELSFHRKPASGQSAPAAQTLAAEQRVENDEAGAGTLADAVKPYIGTPYEKIDCYGLIVRGLQNQGIQYRGHGGIRERLEALAIRNGLPRNAYFSGEGLVEKAGTKVFSKALNTDSGLSENVDEIYSEMKPFLREGFILSFSTPTQGHTGIIARQGEEWTYINSGVIDNQVSPLNLSKGVAEEYLKAEINNWLVLASEKKEPLTVTLGHIEKNRT